MFQLDAIFFISLSLKRSFNKKISLILRDLANSFEATTDNNNNNTFRKKYYIMVMNTFEFCNFFYFVAF